MSITAEVNREIIAAREARDPSAYMSAVQFELTNQLRKVMIERGRMEGRPDHTWAFTDYTNEDGAFACDVCDEDAVLAYTRDSIDGLETYCADCVLEKYPHLNFDIIPTVSAD